MKKWLTSHKRSTKKIEPALRRKTTNSIYKRQKIPHVALLIAYGFSEFLPKNNLSTFLEDHFYRKAMMEWLEKTSGIRESKGITGSLRVSSDIIETANGLWKKMTSRG